MKRLIKVTLIVFFLSSVTIIATPGRLNSASIQTCNGVTYGSHSTDNHWHVAIQNSNGTYNATGDEIMSNPCASTPQPESQSPSTHQQETQEPDAQQKQEVVQKQVAPVKEDPKSTNKEITSIIVDEESIPVETAMTYKTQKEKISLAVNLEDEKARVKHDESITLELGENVTEIVVTAEDESSRTYTLTIVRQEQKKSNNTNITTYVNEEEITFKDYKAEIEFETDALAITHDLEDKKSQTTLDKQYTIDKAESTTLQFIVTAEDGTTRNYEINFIYVNKETNSISGSEIVASLIVFSGFVAVPTYFITKRKNNYRMKITNKL